MSTSYKYRKVTETLAQSLANFETVDSLLFRAGEEADPAVLVFGGGGMGGFAHFGIPW